MPYIPRWRHFSETLLGNFVKTHVIRRNVEVLTDVDFLPIENQLDNENIFLGCATRDGLTKLEEEEKHFFSAKENFLRNSSSILQEGKIRSC